MATLTTRLPIWLTALWWGSLTSLGFLVVPMLFQHMPTPAAAGALAAKLFSAQTWVSAACCMFLLLVLNKRDGTALSPLARALSGLVIAGLLLALLVEFGVAPRIVSARAEGANLRLLHGLGTAMYFAQWVCAGWVLFRLSGRQND